jgi:hypothetical protein
MAFGTLAQPTPCLVAHNPRTLAALCIDVISNSFSGARRRRRRPACATTRPGPPGAPRLTRRPRPPGPPSRAPARAAHPTLRGIPTRFVPKVTTRLPLDLNIEVAATLVDDETYWKRRASARWPNCEVAQHGTSWKRLFFERNLQDFLEGFDPQAQSNEDLIRLLGLSKDYIFSLRLRQLLSHLDLATFFQNVPTLSSLELTYGAMALGMDYERSVFGMKANDVTSLAKALRVTETLTIMALPANQLDDSAIRTLGAARASPRLCARASPRRA